MYLLAILKKDQEHLCKQLHNNKFVVLVCVCMCIYIIGTERTLWCFVDITSIFSYFLRQSLSLLLNELKHSWDLVREREKFLFEQGVLSHFLLSLLCVLPWGFLNQAKWEHDWLQTLFYKDWCACIHCGHLWSVLWTLKRTKSTLFSPSHFEWRVVVFSLNFRSFSSI